MSKDQKPKIFRSVIITLLLSVLLTLIALFFLHRPSNEVVCQWKQPESMVYDGAGPYYVSVVENDLDWTGFPLQVGRHYYIYVGRDSGEPSYGHMIDYSFHHDPSEDLKTFLKKAEVQWTKQGVELKLPSGHRVFIPEKMFTGGR